MPLASAPTPTTVHADPGSQSDTRLSGGLLVLARVGWLSLVALTLGLVVVGFPFPVVQLQRLPAGGEAVCVSAWDVSSSASARAGSF